MKRLKTAATAATLVAVLVLAGCDALWPGGGDDSVPPAATILELRAEPNPVAVGDTIVFTCVVAESTVTALEFWWDPPSVGGIEITSMNRFAWQVTLPPGEYPLAVFVNRTDGEYDEVVQFVDFTVIEAD